MQQAGVHVTFTARSSFAAMGTGAHRHDVQGLELPRWLGSVVSVCRVTGWRRQNRRLPETATRYVLVRCGGPRPPGWDPLAANSSMIVVNDHRVGIAETPSHGASHDARYGIRIRSTNG